MMPDGGVSISAPTAEQPLDANTLAALPSEILNTLELALTRIDLGAVNHAIEEIRSLNPSLADALAPVVKDLQFGKILQLIRSIQADTETDNKAGIVNEP
jgi:uncharacterized protein YhdP